MLLVSSWKPTILTTNVDDITGMYAVSRLGESALMHCPGHHCSIGTLKGVNCLDLLSNMTTFNPLATILYMDDVLAMRPFAPAVSSTLMPPEPLDFGANPDGRRTQELSEDCVRDLTAS
jgi:hypothetical protein